MCKMPPKLKNLYFFLILNSKDIKDKQLTINFNTLHGSFILKRGLLFYFVSVMSFGCSILHNL